MLSIASILQLKPTKIQQYQYCFPGHTGKREKRKKGTANSMCCIDLLRKRLGRVRGELEEMHLSVGRGADGSGGRW
jgi:hypothetical protein